MIAALLSHIARIPGRQYRSTSRPGIFLDARQPHRTDRKPGFGLF